MTKPNNGLSGKIALITGSAKGLGKAAALRLAGLGCDVIVNYAASREEAEALAERIRALGVRSIAVQADVSKHGDLRTLVDRAEQELGVIDILINNAGPFIRERRDFIDYTMDEIEYLMRGNLLGVMELDRLVLPGMRSRGWGRIVHFGFSHAGEARAWPTRAVYAAAKVGLVSFTKTLAEEEAPHGITVNLIGPGDIRGSYKEKAIAEVEGLTDGETPVGRPGTGEDIARVIEFLCRPESGFITGAVLDVSGGLDPIQPLPVLLQKREP
jgi:3-oxoacyl-[acyl-carrier protein] reductase